MFNSLNFNQKENDSQNHYLYEEGFNKEELNEIHTRVQSLEAQKGIAMGAGDDFRSSKVKWIPQEDSWYWLYEKLSDMAVTANDELWNFDLFHIQDQIQYTEYDATDKGHYHWHQDMGQGVSHRKISITVQLSDPSEYEGGDLQLFTGGNYEDNSFITANKAKGAVFIFPSYMLHRVTKVTKGVRRSFVLWVGGSHYR